MTHATAPRLSLTIAFSNGATLSAEDVALIEAIGRVRSILGAARAIDRSYRKTWLMVDALNRAFETPVIATHPGKRNGGGAVPTPFGERVVALYHSLQRRATSGARATLDELEASLSADFSPAATDDASARD